jgi:hypothetical protein
LQRRIRQMGPGPVAMHGSPDHRACGYVLLLDLSCSALPPAGMSPE